MLVEVTGHSLLLQGVLKGTLQTRSLGCIPTWLSQMLAGLVLPGASLSPRMQAELDVPASSRP